MTTGANETYSTLIGPAPTIVPAPQYSLCELQADLGAMQRRVSERLSGVYGDDVVLRTIFAAVVSMTIAMQRDIQQYKEVHGKE